MKTKELLKQIIKKKKKKKHKWKKNKESQS